MAEAHKARSPLQLPEAGAGRYLVDWLFEAGPSLDGKPLPWSEIDAWRRNTGTTINPAEALALRSLSLTYVAEHIAARDPFRVVPGGDEKLENAAKLKNAFRKMTS